MPTTSAPARVGADLKPQVFRLPGARSPVEHHRREPESQGGPEPSARIRDRQDEHEKQSCEESADRRARRRTGSRGPRRGARQRWGRMTRPIHRVRRARLRACTRPRRRGCGHEGDDEPSRPGQVGPLARRSRQPPRDPLRRSHDPRSRGCGRRRRGGALRRRPRSNRVSRDSRCRLDRAGDDRVRLRQRAGDALYRLRRGGLRGGHRGRRGADRRRGRRLGRAHNGVRGTGNRRRRLRRRRSHRTRGRRRDGRNRRRRDRRARAGDPSVSPDEEAERRSNRRLDEAGAKPRRGRRTHQGGRCTRPCVLTPTGDASSGKARNLRKNLAASAADEARIAFFGERRHALVRVLGPEEPPEAV